MKKNKDHKKGESTIGKIIYGFLLFMPLFAIGVTCLVSTFNKNVGVTGNEEQETLVTSFEELNDFNETFTWKAKYHVNDTRVSVDTYVSNVHYISGSLNQSQIESLENATYIRTWFDINLNANYFTWADLGSNIGISQTGGLALLFTFNYGGINNTQGKSFDFIYDSQIYKTHYVDLDTINVFYYSVDKVTESPLFSWATNSIIYTGINSTCNQLSITTPFIPLLLTYWLIISVIYFLYDIILIILQIFHRKIHELQESI